MRFDVEEALEELTRLQLVEKVGSEESGNGNESGGTRYTCMGSQEATQHLQSAWEGILQGRLQSIEAPSG